jgi:transcriptional regulator with XRE-family HTH domain
LATVEIERTPAEGGDAPDSTSFRLVPSSRAARVRRIDPGEDLGSALRKARRRRKISLAQASRDTRIGLRYLTALERGAPLDEFPAPMYARAFLREYARYLRLEAEPLLQLLAPYEPPPVAPSLAVLARVAPRKRSGGRLVALFVAAAVSVLLVLAADDPLPRPSTPVSDLDETIPAAAPATGDTGDNAAPATDDVARGLPGVGAITADLRASGRSWLRVVADGEVVYEGMAAQGWSRSFSGGDRVEILIGNAGAVELLVNGQSMGPLGAAGEVRRLLITAGTGGPVVRNLARSA